MARMVWVAIGAAGGIFAYKKLERVINEAKTRGLVGNLNAATESATQVANNVKTWQHKTLNDLQEARTQRPPQQRPSHEPDHRQVP